MRLRMCYGTSSLVSRLSPIFTSFDRSDLHNLPVYSTGEFNIAIFFFSTKEREIVKMETSGDVATSLRLIGVDHIKRSRHSFTLPTVGYLLAMQQLYPSIASDPRGAVPNLTARIPFTVLAVNITITFVSHHRKDRLVFTS